jgi:UMF1 family MFS transporter
MRARTVSAKPRSVEAETAKRAGPLGLVGWVLFDWATQPFYTLVLTFVFAPYFVNGFIGDPAHGSALWGYAIGAAGLITAVLAPVFGAMADIGLPRKPWIAGFSVLFVIGLCGLWLAVPGRADLAPFVLLAFAIAGISAELATVFNNAIMPSLVLPQRLGTLSGIGWATAYAGGLISLVLVTGLIVADPISGKTLLGLQPIIPLDPATHEGDRLIGQFAALWYAIFVLPLFLFTPDRPARTQDIVPIRHGLSQLARAIKELVRDHPPVALFLLARMLYADGLGAVFAFGGIYAATVLSWDATDLGLFGIILTVSGTIGAAFGGVLDDRFGSKAVIMWMLLLFSLSALGVLFQWTRIMSCLPCLWKRSFKVALPSHL